MGRFMRRRRLMNTSIRAEAAFVPLSSLTTAITYFLFATAGVWLPLRKLRKLF
jgi:hypothetical protein